MYYITAMDMYFKKYYNLYHIKENNFYCIGRTNGKKPSQCNFTNILEMKSLIFDTTDYDDNPSMLKELKALALYSSDTYPDVANLFQTHPELFL